MLRFLTAGESHGKALVAILEGMVADLPLAKKDIDREMARRQVGYGRGGRMKIEKDEVEILSGVRLGKTLGSPIALMIDNKDFKNWKDIMSDVPRGNIKAVTKLRPGHADLAGILKYHQSDIRNILERASARETAARVGIGAIAKKLLSEFGITVLSHVLKIGDVRAPLEKSPDYYEIMEKAEKSPLRTFNKEAEEAMKNAIDKAKDNGDSVGGIFEVVVLEAPAGLGSHVEWDRRLDGRLARAVMSIPAVKGVEIGLGFAGASLFGSSVHDEIIFKKGKFSHLGNNAGGIEGGITNGEAIVIRGAMKPISTLGKPLRSVDIRTKKACEAHVERADVCAVPSASVVGEAVVALEIAGALLEKFGGDTLSETKASYKNYLSYLSKI